MQARTTQALTVLIPILTLAVAGTMISMPAGAADRPGLVSLELPIGPRAVGMGSAYVSVADDATAMYWNPAGLTRLTVPEKHFEFLFQHNEWISDFRQEYIGGGTRLGRHAFGGSFSGFYVGDIDGRDEFGAHTVDFGAYDVSVTASYAYSLSERLALGASGKYLVSNIDNLTNFAFAADIGGQYEVRPDLWIGGAVTNIGRGLRFIHERDDLPTAVQVGGSYVLPVRLGNSSILVATDVRKVRGDDGAHLLVGGELDYAGLARFQLGYRSGYDNDNLSVGFGTSWEGWRIGYAVVPFDSDLGTTHRVAIGFRL